MYDDNRLYPPVKIVRQNQSHILRVLIRSEDMIGFLQNNYATPVNRDKPYCYFDIIWSSDKSKLVGITEKNMLEVVNGYDNPEFDRRVKQIVKKRRGQPKEKPFEPNITRINKDEILDRTKRENQIFIGEVTHVFPLETFTKRDGKEAGVRSFIVENEQDGFLQTALFEIYREKKFLNTIDENFVMSVGDLVKVEYFMTVTSFVASSGETKYNHKNKVYRVNYLVDKPMDGFDPKQDNPFEEVIDVSNGTKLLSDREKLRLMKQKQ